MKISARTCSRPLEAIEPDLEFYLDETSDFVILAVRDKNSGFTISNLVLSVRKISGKIERHGAINPKFGLPLDSSGRLKLTSEG
jgi:hypothetical protein